MVSHTMTSIRWRPGTAVISRAIWSAMMTSSNGNIFRVTGHVCREFTGPGECPTQRLVTRSFDVFFDLRLNKRLSTQSWGWWFETQSSPLWRQCNAYWYVVLWTTTYSKPFTGGKMSQVCIQLFNQLPACQRSGTVSCYVIWSQTQVMTTICSHLKGKYLFLNAENETPPHCELQTSCGVPYNYYITHVTNSLYIL